MNLHVNVLSTFLIIISVMILVLSYSEHSKIVSHFVPLSLIVAQVDVLLLLWDGRQTSRYF